jgi:MFS transporter, ACS family, tartrate transporter
MTTSSEGPEARIVGRVIGRLIPFIFLCYVVAYVDRVNISFAAAFMQRDLRLGDDVYGFGAGLFFLGYFLFEIPSNLILERVGARLWIARIMLVWGLISMATVWVKDAPTFYALRVLLGVAEAGFFPGMVLYLTYWIPARQRARAGALFMTAAPVAMMVGAPASEALLKLEGVGGLHGWQWLFLAEGLPAVLLGVAAFFYLTDRPEQARWLAPEDREWLGRHLEREHSARARHGSGLRHILSGRVLLLCLIFFLNTFATYGVFLFLPKMLREASGYSGFKLSAITAIPFVVALFGMVLIGRHSDRTGERKLHVAACALLGALGLALAAASRERVPLIVLSFTIAQLGQRAIQSVFWAIPPAFLGGTAAAAGIAMINAVGNLGGFVGPWAVGSLRHGSESYTAGLLLMAAALVVEAVLISRLRLTPPAPAEVEPALGPARVLS